MAGDRYRFGKTRWSVVMAVGDCTTDDAYDALTTLCHDYWHPIYFYVRRRGYPPQDAEDMTQDFFRFLLEKKVIQKARPERGKFRTFILTSLKNFLGEARIRANAQKRGGGVIHVPLEVETAEGEYTMEIEAHNDIAPEDMYDRRWALAILERAYSHVRNEYNKTNKSALFAALQSYLTRQPEAGTAKRLSGTLNMSEGAIRVALHRMRRRFREVFYDEIAQTLSDPSELDDEVRYLMGLLGR